MLNSADPHEVITFPSYFPTWTTLLNEGIYLPDVFSSFLWKEEMEKIVVQWLKQKKQEGWINFSSVSLFLFATQANPTSCQAAP